MLEGAINREKRIMIKMKMDGYDEEILEDLKKRWPWIKKVGTNIAIVSLKY